MRFSKVKWDRLAALADKLSNISKACALMGVSRSLYYKWTRVARWNPVAQLPSSSRRRHPHAISQELKNQILAIARSNPEWGCQRISYFLGIGRKESQRNYGFTKF